jgi:hypothetical protein
MRRIQFVVIGGVLIMVIGVALWWALRPDAVTRHVRAIRDRGQDRGNLPHVFTVVGDSISADQHFLTPFAGDSYDLGKDDELQSTIRYFRGPNGRGDNPFAARSEAVHVGWMTETVLDPYYADLGICQLDESPLVCEYRINKPSVAVIMLGTNDITGGRTLDTFTTNVRRIIDISEDMGVIPILSTIPPNLLDEQMNAQVEQFNAALIKIAKDEQIPWMDFWHALQGVPDYGISADGLHPNAPPDGNSAIFDSDHLQYGYTIRNRVTLRALDRVRQMIE